MPLSMKHARAKPAARGRHCGQLMLARDPHMFVIVPMAHRILALLPLRKIVECLPERVIGDDTTAFVEEAGKVSQSRDLLLVEFCQYFMVLSFNCIGDEPDDGGEAVLGAKQMRLDESMRRFHFRCCAIVEVGQISSPSV